VGSHVYQGSQHSHDPGQRRAHRNFFANNGAAPPAPPDGQEAADSEGEEHEEKDILPPGLLVSRFIPGVNFTAAELPSSRCPVTHLGQLRPDSRPVAPGEITSIGIIGERHTGSNWLTTMLQHTFHVHVRVGETFVSLFEGGLPILSSADCSARKEREGGLSLALASQQPSPPPFICSWDSRASSTGSRSSGATSALKGRWATSWPSPSFATHTTTCAASTTSRSTPRTTAT
jgi:hypothetical protein